MRPYVIRFTREAAKDVEKLTPRLKTNLKQILLNKVSQAPYTGKKLVGELDGFYSVRLTYQDRIVYTIHDDTRNVVVHRARAHYGD